MKKQINLYQPSCYPKRDKATYKQLLFLVGICLLSIFVLWLILNKQFSDIQDRTQQQKTLLSQKQEELQLFAAKLKNNQAPEAKVRQQLALQKEIKVKQDLLASLSGIELGASVSFSELMKGLSLANMSTVSIDHFSIIDGRVNISGQAKQSDSVPLWLTKVQMTKELSGIAFEKLKISESKNGKGFFFQLVNKVKTEPVKGQNK